MSETREEMLARHARELATMDESKLSRCGCGGFPSVDIDKDMNMYRVMCSGCNTKSVWHGIRRVAIEKWNRAMSRPKLGLWVAGLKNHGKYISFEKPLIKNGFYVEEYQSIQIPLGHPIDLLTADMTWESDPREI